MGIPEDSGCGAPLDFSRRREGGASLSPRPCQPALSVSLWPLVLQVSEPGKMAAGAISLVAVVGIVVVVAGGLTASNRAGGRSKVPRNELPGLVRTVSCLCLPR